jgi:chromosome segregation ATPase
MNPLYFLRANPWAKFFMEPDKGGSSGGGSQKPLTVVELTQRVQALEGEKTTLTTERDDLKAKVGTLEAEKATLTTERDDLKAKVGTLEGEKATLTTDLATANSDKTKLTTDLATANTAKTNAEAALVTADERAETRLREISAKNGGTLPPKDHTAGNSQTGGKPENKLTGREKTIAYLAARQPKANA